jgi:mannose-6-phosphate isomerase
MTKRAEMIGPLVLAPMTKQRVWGSRALAPWYDNPGGEPVGEVWLTALGCMIETGPLKGETLQDAVSRFPESVGQRDDAGSVTFPLLMKVLFPNEKLSVQVHPNDAQAQERGEPNGKTECWYVLSAEPGATVAVGFAEKLTREQMKAAVLDGSVEAKLRHVPVKAGDLVYVDAGTVHAIGPGVVVLETQQYSDVTYRLFDYGRGRELHLEKGLDVARAETAAGLVTARPSGDRMELVRCEYFVVERWRLQRDVTVTLNDGSGLQVLIALADGCTVESALGVVALPKAHAVVLPAESVEYTLRGVGDVVRVRP